MHCSADMTQNFGENNVKVLDGYPKNQKQKTMHTNPDYNLLELDHTFTRLQQLNLQAGKKDVFIINTQKKTYQTYKFVF